MAVELGVNSGFVAVRPTADPGGSDVVIDGASVVTKHTAPTGAKKITEIGWYRGSGTNTANFEIALYADTSGAAGARLAVDATNSSSSAGWITTSVDWNITAGTSYWLGLQMDAHSGSSNVDNATSGGAGYDRMTSQTALADPYGGGAVADADGMAAIYALYDGDKTASAGLGELTLTGFAPTVTLSDNKNIAIALGELTITGYVPTISIEAVAQTSPTVALDTTDATEFKGEDTPLLEFTGTDDESDDVLYEIQIDTVNTFDSGGLIDKVSGTDAGFAVLGDEQIDDGGFDGASLDAQWGAFGSAVTLYDTDSDSIGRVDVLKIESNNGATATCRAIYTFTSPLTNGDTYRCKYRVYVPSGNTDTVGHYVYYRTSSSQNAITENNTTQDTWVRKSLDTTLSSENKDSIQFGHVDGASSTANIAVGDDLYFDNISVRKLIDATSPFTSGTKCSFRVQDANALTDNTKYYWRVRAKDPSGSNDYGDWSETRYFNVGTPANNIEVTAGLGEITLTGYAPTVAVTDNKNIAVGLGEITLTGYLPTVTATDHKNITIGLGEITLTGYAPTVAVSDNKNIAIGLGEITLTGYEPTVVITDLKNITIGLGELLLEGFAPTVALSDNKNIGIGLGEIVLTGYEPTVFATDLKNITIGLGEVAIEGFAPTIAISDNKNISIGLGELSLVGYEPTVAITDNKNISIDLGQLVLTGYEPTIAVSDNKNITPELGELSISGYAPELFISQSAITSTGELILTGYAPSVDITNHINIITGLGEINLDGFAPIAYVPTDQEVFPPTGGLVLTGYAPEVWKSTEMFYWDGADWQPIGRIQIFN